MTVEATWTQQRCIEDLGLVGRSKNNDWLVLGSKTIHFGEQLVERLLALIISTHNSHGARTTLTNGIKFIDKNDARRFLLGFLKQVADTSCACTNKQLNKFRAGDNEERNFRLTGYRLGQQCFACSRRAYQQHPFRNASTNLCITLRRFEEVNDFSEFVFGFINTSNISEGDARFFIGYINLGFALGEAQGTLCASTHRTTSKKLKNDDKN